jgi:hypothetical protein
MDFVVSSRTDYGGIKKTCFKCKCDVFPLDNTISFARKTSKAKRMGFICFECYTLFYADTDQRLVPTDDACKMFGLSRVELVEITKVMAAAQKQRMVDDSLAG